MNITPFLRQTATWQVWTGTDAFDKRTYAASVNIKCRVTSSTREIMALSGDTQPTEWKVRSIVQPKVGDLLNGREVVLVSASVDASGATVGWVSRTT